MPQTFGNYVSHNPLPKSPVFREPSNRVNGNSITCPENKPTYAKVFRWRLPDGQTHEPATVEVVGSFTHWQKVPMMRDGVLDAWHVTVHKIESHKTHHYMILVDGHPVQDKNADGLAIPHGPQEEQYQLMTPRGPRLFMMFAQTK